MSYKYIMHGNGNWTAITEATAARWAQERRAADVIRATPSKAARDESRRQAMLRRKRAARARRKAAERAEGARIRANRPQIGERMPA